MELKVLQWYWGFSLKSGNYSKSTIVYGEMKSGQADPEATELRERYPGDFSKKNHHGSIR